MQVCTYNVITVVVVIDCTSEADKCNGYADCADGSDEDNTMCSSRFIHLGFELGIPVVYNIKDLDWVLPVMYTI